MSLPPDTLLKAPQEKLAPDYLEKYFHLIQTNLPIADYWNAYQISCDLIMTESKINADGMNLPTLCDELTRMNYAEYQEAIRHAVWLWTKTMERAYLRHIGWHSITSKIVEEMYESHCNRFRSLCYQANVYPHIVKSKSKYVKKMQEIFKGSYDSPLQIHKQPSQKISEWERVLCLSKGTTEKTALKIGGFTTKDEIYQAFGLKKDGDPQKKALDLVKYLARLYNRIRPILES